MEEIIVPKIKELKIDDLKVIIPSNLAEKEGEFWFTKDSWQAKNICISFLFEGHDYRFLSCGIYRIYDNKKWNVRIFNKLKSIDANLSNDSNIENSCVYWRNVENIEYSNDVLPICYFIESDKFIESVKISLLKLAEIIDDIIKSYDKDYK